MTASINAFIVEGTHLKAHVESDQGATLTLVGEFTDAEPTVDSGGVLEKNPAHIHRPTCRMMIT